jgi:hypothetical protein
MVFENRMLRRIFGPEKLHNEELHNLLSVTDIIKMISQGG